jgi:hypothetical protein
MVMTMVVTGMLLVLLSVEPLLMTALKEDLQQSRRRRRMVLLFESMRMRIKMVAFC